MTRTETLAEGVTLYLGDCREILPTLGKVDAVVTDPPYGLDGLLQGGKSQWSLHNGGSETQKWDAVTVPCVNDLPALCEHVIVWGGQFYALPRSRGWLVWNKIIRNWSSGECEFAWSNLDQPIRAFDYSHGQLANEIEPKYFDIACRRIQAALDAPDLFIEQPKPAEARSTALTCSANCHELELIP